MFFFDFWNFPSTPNIIDSKVFGRIPITNHNVWPEQLNHFIYLRECFESAKHLSWRWKASVAFVLLARGLSFFAVHCSTTHRQLANGPPPENQTIEMESKKCCTIHQINRNSMTLCSSGTVYGCALSIDILMYRANTHVCCLFSKRTTTRRGFHFISCTVASAYCIHKQERVTWGNVYDSPNEYILCSPTHGTCAVPEIIKTIIIIITARANS